VHNQTTIIINVHTYISNLSSFKNDDNEAPLPETVGASSV